MTFLGNIGTLIAPYTTDASPSWNGYNHQGKVGIYVVLKMMEEITQEEMNKYELELEWLEDFSIKKEGKYQSIHQVKTYADTATSKYKDAIWLLLAKLLDIEELDNAFLHVTQQLTNVDQLEKNLFNYTIPEDKPEENKKNEKNSSKKQKNTVYATPKECHDKVKLSGKYNKLFKKFSLYDYGNSLQYCSLEEIEEAIKKQLKPLIGEDFTETRAERAYYYLLGLVDKNIRKRQMDIQAGNNQKKVTINFQKVYDIVSQNFEFISKEYAAFYLKNEFNKITQSYLEDLKVEFDEKSISEDEISIIHKTIEYTNKLDESRFLEFCLKITPDNEVNKELPEHIIKMIDKCLNETSLNEGFFEILKQIKRELEYEKLIYSKKNQAGANITYLPSTIVEEFHPSRTRKLAKKIINNSQPEMLNEVDNIITKSINLPCLEDSKVYSNVPDPNDGNSEKTKEYHNRITKIKKISLIDINKAKGDLSN